MDKCTHCGSSNIKKGITIGPGNNKIGLKYTDCCVPHTEIFHADLCKDCGNIRIYVKETNRNWV